MKRIIFLFAAIVVYGTIAFASTNISAVKANNLASNYVRGYGNSFIFMEAGIEFSVFADGQFDFYMPDYGPNVNVGFYSPNFSISFNSGYNYNPYVQYDSLGAIIQIENTPIFYDYYGRVNQIGNIFINYNAFGRISRVGGLNVYYRNNVFWRYDGFINSYNRAYVYRPWHRFYALPPVNYCVINVNPYRQFYRPIRHIYYRPYRNNVRYFNINNTIRRSTQYGRRGNLTRISDRYVQRPRNDRERSIRRNIKRRNATITSTRASRLRDTKVTTTRTRTNVNGKNVITARTQSNRGVNRVVTPNKTKQINKTTHIRTRNNGKNITRTRTTVSNKTQKVANARKPRVTNSQKYSRSTSQNNRQQNNVAQSKRKSSSVLTRSGSRRSRS